MKKEAENRKRKIKETMEQQENKQQDCRLKWAHVNRYIKCKQAK